MVLAAVACMYSHFLLRMNVDPGGVRGYAAIIASELSRDCRCSYNSYLTGLVVVSADLPLRPVVHGNRGGFIFRETDSEHELGVALQATA